ncbi:MAG: hypothetical protein ABJB47_20505 [Actinomycetota bacterium]
MSWAGFGCGIVLLLATATSVMKTLLIPRSTRSRVTGMVAHAVLSCFRLITGPITDLASRERILAAGCPAFLMSLLGCWLVSLLAGYALVLWPVVRSFPQALREAGSALLTLGFAAPAGAAPAGIVFAAAASGLIVVALQIAYLPVLYAAYNRRETLVTMLEALAGAPAWGPELLARQALIGNVSYLPRLYERWTEWAADISESHVNYRTLAHFRSPDPVDSWLLALLGVLDAAALHHSLCPRSVPSEVRPLLRVGFLTTQRLAASLQLDFPADPSPDDPIRLTRAEFDEGVAWLRAAGFQTERSADEAWPQFRGWRVNYEAACQAMTYYLDLPPALWSGPRRPGRPDPEPPRRPKDRQPAASFPAAGTGGA